MLSAGGRFNPADITVVAAVDHVEFPRCTILEHQRIRVAKIEQHDRVGDAGFRDVDLRLGNNRRMHCLVLFDGHFRLRREDRVAGIFHELRRAVGFVLAKPLGIFAELLLDLVSRTLERDVRLGGSLMRFQDDVVDDRGDDVADKVCVGPRTERHVRSNCAWKIFLSESFDPAHGLSLQGISDVDLMARHPYVHLTSPPFCAARRLGALRPMRQSPQATAA